jgi:ABC-type multidrug transport system fused ATPase/permease subunit
MTIVITAPSPSVLQRGARLLWRSVRTHPRPFAVSVFGSTLFGVTAVGGSVALGAVTDRVIVPGIEDGVSRGALVAGAAAILVIATLRSLGVVLRRYFGNMTARRMQRTLFRRITDTYLTVPLGYFGRHPTGELLAHADADVERAVTAIQPLPFSLGVVVLVGISIASLAVVDPLLMLVGLALFPALALLNRVYTKHVEVPAALTQARIGEVSTVAHESFEGALVVKTLGLETREVERLSAAAEQLRSVRLRVGRLRAAFEPGLDALPNLGTIALLAIGAWRVSAGAITIGELVQAMAMFGILAFPMRVVGFLLEELPRAAVAADRISAVLAEPRRPAPSRAGAASSDAADAAGDGDGDGDGQGVRPLPDGPLAVEVGGLRFGYGAEPVLDGLELSLAPGEVVALVGATGTGKSTLCHLLAQLHEPDAGTIRLGGVDLAVAEATSVRRSVALAFQEAFLFAATVRENLALGEPIPEDELAWAVEQARAQRFVARLPAGLDQQLGERGVRLSGGQRQRLALARALLRRPGLLLLDDATSAVDPLIERQILDGLRDSLQATTLIVAHRISTIGLADRVLFLDGGRIAASGTHRELVASVPAYATLARAYDRDRS